MCRFLFLPPGLGSHRAIKGGRDLASLELFNVPFFIIRVVKRVGSIKE